MTGVLITGGAGFIGSHLVDRLMADGLDVAILDNFYSGRIDNIRLYLGKRNFKLIKGDVRKKDDLNRALKNVEYVFHLAAIVDVETSIKNPMFVNDVNVNGTLSILEQCLKFNVDKFIFASSCAVYGEPVYLPIDEEHPTKPVSPYGVTKLAAENYCRAFYKLYGLKTVCLRLFNVYGLRQSTGNYAGVIVKFIERLKNGQPPVIFGDGEQTRDFIHVKDVVEALINASKNEHCAGETFNIGSGVETSVGQLAKKLINIFGLQVKPVYSNPKAGDIKRSCANIDKAKRILRFKTTVPLDFGLNMLVRELALNEYQNEHHNG